MKKLKLRTFQIGSPTKRGDGLRIGVTRLPPRGVPRHRWQRDGYFDVWFPVVAPSAPLLRRALARGLADATVRRRFFTAYERELKRPAARQCVELLAQLAMRMPIAIGCFCDDESRCHRSRLRKAIERAAGELV
jgi:uncharacterized protein YeaO (DUF488 family)